VSPLSIGVAITAAIALVAGVTKKGVEVLGLAADPTLLSLGAVGLLLALTTFRSSLISPFLRAFSTFRRRICRDRACLCRGRDGLVASKLGGSRAAREPSHRRCRPTALRHARRVYNIFRKFRRESSSAASDRLGSSEFGIFSSPDSA
jgi:hypothetical protein